VTEVLRERFDEYRSVDVTMADSNEIRTGEVAVEPPAARDAGLEFIGRIHTPWKTRAETPRQGKDDGPVCRIEVFDTWAPALKGLEEFETIFVLYWLHQSRRDLVTQSPRGNGATTGTFALRSPVRPNPVGLSSAKLVGIEGNVVLVRGLDCLDGTPLIDIKPDRCHHS
jgi:tRNA (adenine37-N6)-methyltransferase